MSMRAKTSGCSTNLAIINDSCSGGVGSNSNGKQSNPILVASEQIKLDAEAAEGSRAASLEGSCTRRPSRRASRRVSGKRSSLRWSISDSVNLMDFGVSEHLAMLDESCRSSLPDESRRSFASLETPLIKNCFGKDGIEESWRSIETRSEADLEDYADSYQFMNWPPPPKEQETTAATNRVNPSVEVQRGAEEGKTSHLSQESSGNRRSFRRSIRHQSRRRSSRHGSLRWSGRSSANSGASSNLSDSLISESGFMAWPSAAQEDTIQEERADEMKKEEKEWKIEDYEKNFHDSDRNGEGNSPSTFAKTFQIFARLPSRRASNASSGPVPSRRATSDSSDLSKDSRMDLFKIKQTLLSAKNKNQDTEVAGEDADKIKRGGSISLISMFQQSMAAELDNVGKKTGPMPQALASMHDGSSGGGDEPRRRRSREHAIWVRQKSNIEDDPDVYKKLYSQAISQ